MMRLEGKLLDGYGRLVGSGIVLDDDGVLTEVLPAREGVSGWITPGFLDIHNHGGGGASFPDDTDDEGIAAAIAAHRELGTSGLLASLVSMIDPLPAINALVPWCERGELLGIHLEGPYISPHKCGAQNPAAVREPDLDELRSWLEAGRGWIRTMTIAPEVARAQEAAELLLDYGAVPSWGHTSALGAQALERLRDTAESGRARGFGRPPQTATHLFNAMPPLAHREPGPVREFIQAARRGECVVELVADGIHLHPDLVSDVTSYVGDSDDGALGVVFVTDAMAGAGMPDGAYELGGLPVTIADGVARLTHGGAIAGGTARMAEEIKRMVSGDSVSIEQAVRACVAAPAAALGLDDSYAGVTLEWRVGTKPSVVCFEENFDVVDVWREGARIVSHTRN
ncbi:N-acetylglucosamine-6-phosphate deacetylase [Arcanobacterium pluranimalium]|uniref:N-acetylglucosamine-6-phosphate deacetylase n=1 Tax=Arcanobacterium pluranimalium TaxID=108028 RepID=UPI001EF93727|nr:amidohydrolase family protein [Arcanobacterium pluranimalium]MBM7825860.1 N-acetylglucosamine-6-phosphate deacetylase [Arcanobacterium pluranimalium]